MSGQTKGKQGRNVPGGRCSPTPGVRRERNISNQFNKNRNSLVAMKVISFSGQNS